MAGEIVWPFDADLSDPVVEWYGYLTDVMEAQGREQRTRLRRHPIGGMEVTFRGGSEWESQLVEPLIAANQHRAWIVPLWQYACQLAVAAAPGSVDLFCDTSYVPFQDPAGGGTMAIIWKNFREWETVTIESVLPNEVVVTPGILGSYGTGSMVMPVRVGRMERSVVKVWEGGSYTSGRVRFSWDPWPDPIVVPGGAGGDYVFSGEGMVGVNP